ncbi:MAG: putative lipid II flippase FtsW [Deltaproteobacteria bacterium]|nr:putative lipid II flippase FtsW [Deltaproteobacteria bacterium]MBW2363533.1 putative lipid II flippase FtsW [Deltaproteobacteria bacterium]
MKKPITHSNQTSASGTYDIPLMFPVLFLVGIGIVMVYSASSALALKKFGSDFYFLKKQALFALIGILVLVACKHIPYKVYRHFTYPLLLLSIVFLIAVHISGLTYTAGGSTRWIRIGSFTFQPSEFARFSLIIYLAYSLNKKMADIKDFYIGFLPHTIVLSVFTLLIFIQPDFGSIVILGTITWMMMFIGGVRLLHLATSLVLLLPVAYLFLTSAQYRVSRLVSFLNPWQYPTDEGYQIIHSFMAFGSGGIWGAGIGKGYQKLFYLPEPHTDFIFSVIGEELGLIGVLIILSLYFLILWRGISIARNAKDMFGAFLAIGFTSAITLQACINMCVALGLLPTKGLTLPFLSYGGTSLLINMACVGILMNIGASRTQ